MKEFTHRVHQLFKNYLPDEPSRRLVVGVSGGVDSIVLLHTILYMRDAIESFNHEIIVAHFYHGLRAENDQATDYIRHLCKQKEIPYAIGTWPQSTRQSSELAARNARYGFFAEVLKDFETDYLLTAHHSDDQAETLLMRIIRGTSLKGLQGMTLMDYRTVSLPDQGAVGAWIFRPLLPFSKQEITQIAHEQQWQYVDDVTNDESSYTRNRYRHHWLPQLKEENPQLERALTNLANQLQLSYQGHWQNYQLIEPELFGQLSNGWVIDRQGYLQLSSVFQEIYLQMFFEERLTDVIPSYHRHTVAHLRDLLIRTGVPHGMVDLGNGWLARREYDLVFIERASDAMPVVSANQSILLQDMNRWYEIAEGQRVGVFSRHHLTSSAIQDATMVIGLAINPIRDLPMVLRYRQPGDRIALAGPDNTIFHKKIARIMIDDKIPQRLRNKCWLLVSRHDEILALLPNYIAATSEIHELNSANYIFIYENNS